MNEYAVRVARAARKELQSVDRVTDRSILAAIERLASDPRPLGCRELQGARDLSRLRIGAYRVIYSIGDTRGISGSRAGGYFRLPALCAATGRSPDSGRVTIWVDAQLSPALAPWPTHAFNLDAVAVRDLEFGVTVGRYLRDVRTHRGLERLRTSRLKVGAIAKLVGFRGKANFYAAVGRATGTPPVHVRARARSGQFRDSR